MAFIGWFCFLLIVFQGRANYIQNDSLEIVGGDEIKIESAPFMAIYRPKGQVHGCGASIINKEFLVTAAHCAEELGEEDAEIVVGTDNIVKGGETHDIKAVYIHPHYSGKDNDVAVVQLVKQLVFSSRVQPIKMAERGLVIPDGAIFQTMGFGVTVPETLIMSDVLLAVDVPYVNSAKCSEAYPFYSEHMICAGRRGKDSCLDDSGGPLRYKNTLIGVVSFGHSCAQEGWPGVYARVSALRDFIDNVVNRMS